MKEIIIVGMILIFLYKVMSPSKFSNKFQAINHLEPILLGVHNEINSYIVAYEVERDIAKKSNNPIIEEIAFDQLKEKMSTFPSNVKESLNNAKNKID